MLQKVHKLFWSYEKEENWLNEMAARGMMLRGYTWGTYFFEQGQPGEYVYRLELLKNLPTHPESQAYIEFLKDAEIEHVASYLRWVYFRKKANDGPFDLYSDKSLKIKHYQRILALFGVVFSLNLFAMIMNIAIGMIQTTPDRISHNLYIALLPAFISICLGILCFSYIKQVRRLKKEAQLRE